MRSLIVLLVAAAASFASLANAQPMPIEAYVSDPNFRSARLSPDGRYVLGIRTTPAGDSLLRIDWRTGQVAVLQQVQRGEIQNQIDWAEWKSNDRLILSVSTTRRWVMRNDRSAHIRDREAVDVGVTRIVAINADGSNLRAMFEGQTRNLGFRFASTQLVDTLPNDPQNVLIAAYGPNGLGLYRGDVNTGRTTRIDDGDWYGMNWGVDGLGNAVLRLERLPANAGYRIYRRAPDARNWTEFAEVRGGEDINSPEFAYVAPGPGAGEVWVYARPEGRDTTGLYLFNTATAQYSAVHYEHPRADFVGDVWTSRNNDRILAACVRYQRRECRYFDEAVGRNMRAVDSFFAGAADVTLENMSDDGAVWLLNVQGPSVAPSYYIYDQARRAVQPVTAARPFADEHLAPMEVVNYAARDGQQLWGYLTTPRNAPARNAPLVVFVHGGPESRDHFRFDQSVQFFASRGYLVFQPQFRGSGGYGIAFANQGHRQWGQRMQHDVTDGVQHLIQSGRVDPQRICIVGHSYGGYAALAGATLTPDLYRCAISVNGVSDLREMLRWEAQEGGRLSAALDYWRRSIGDPNTDRAMIDAASPRLQAAAARAPILIVAGDQDTIVPVEQSRFMRDALTRAGKDFRYVEIPRVGHSWFWWELPERTQLFTEMDNFLATHLRN